MNPIIAALLRGAVRYAPSVARTIGASADQLPFSIAPSADAAALSAHQPSPGDVYPMERLRGMFMPQPGDPSGAADSIAADAKRRWVDRPGASSPHHRIMGAFDDMLASRKGDSLPPSPQHMIDKGFNDVSMGASGGMPWWMQQPTPPQAPAAPQAAPAAPQAPMQQLPLPPGQRTAYDMPSAQVPHTPFNPAPVAPPSLSWFQRNGMEQRDPETGQYLDPAMAQRAMAQGGGLFG